MIAILKREWKSYFQNITGWLFIAAVLALYGLYFLAYNLRAGYPYVSYTLSAISFIMLIAVPILDPCVPWRKSGTAEPTSWYSQRRFRLER